MGDSRKKMRDKKAEQKCGIKISRIKISGIKSRIKIGGDPQTLGGGNPSSVSAKRSQQNKKWNKN